MLSVSMSLTIIPHLYCSQLRSPLKLKSSKHGNWCSRSHRHRHSLVRSSKSKSKSNGGNMNYGYRRDTQMSMSEEEKQVGEYYNYDCWVDPVWLVSFLGSRKRLKQVRAIHAVILKRLRWMDSIVYVNNNLINVYLGFGNLSEARKVFDEMPHRSTVSWTAMLNAYLKFGFDDEAVCILDKFVRSGVRPNQITFACILNLCGKRCDYELGKQVHGAIIKGKASWSSNVIVDTSISYFYAQCGDFPSAFRVFDNMKERDVVTWTTIITCCSQQGYGHQAISLFSQMLLHEDYFPNQHTVSSVFKACGDEKALHFGRQLHGIVAKKSVLNDVFIGTSLVAMYSRCGQIQDSRKVFDRMTNRNMVTWTSIISGYARNGLGHEALSLFRVMKRRKVVANNLTIVSILRACGSIGALRTGKEVHAQILKISAHNNIYIGSTLVWLYCKCREYHLASKVLQKMPLRDVVAWTAIISGCAHLGYEFEALEFLKKMVGEGVDPNPFTYSSLLKACAKLEAIQQGRLIHSSVNKFPAFTNNVFVGSALINMYSKCGYVSEAFQVFSSMPERNLVSWRSMIVGYAKNGYCQEALKLMYQMQTQGIQVDDYLITTVLSACGDVEWNLELSSQHCLQPT